MARTQSSCHARGIALTELMLALVVFVLAVVPTLSLLIDVARQPKRSADLFREATLASTVWEIVKARAAVDPGFLRAIAAQPGWTAVDGVHPDVHDKHATSLVSLGSFVTPTGPLDAQGQPIAISPFAQFLINRTGGPLYAASNSDPLAKDVPAGTVTTGEIAGLREGLKSLAVRVTVIDGAEPSWNPTARDMNAPIAITERIKDVTIEVFRAGSDNRIPATPAYTLHGAIETPPGSLSVQAQRELTRMRDDYGPTDDLADAYGAVIDGVRASGLPGDRAIPVADFLLIAIEAAGEAMDTEGSDLGMGLPGASPVHSLGYWATCLKGRVGRRASRLRAEVTEEEARRILLAFHRAQGPMNALVQHIQRFSPRLDRVLGELEAQAQVFRSASGPDAADVQAASRAAARAMAHSSRALFIECAMWVQILGQPRWLNALQRVLDYPARYDADLRAALDIRKELESRTNATVMEHMAAIDAILAPMAARKLFLGVPVLPDDALILDRIARFRPAMAPYADAIAASEPLNFKALQERCDALASLSSALRALAVPDHPYRLTIREISPAELSPKLTRIRAVLTILGLTDILAKIDRDLWPFAGHKVARSHRALVESLAAELVAERSSMGDQ